MARRFLALAAAAVALPLLVGPAGPAGAGRANADRVPASWEFTGGDVTGALTASSSGVELVDYTGGEYYDRVRALPGRDEPLTVAGAPCAHGTAYSGGLIVYGATPDWAQMAVGSQTGARVEIACTLPDGSIHRYHWGNYRQANGKYLLPRTDCVVLRHPSADVFTLEIPATGCPTQDETIAQKPGKQLASVDRYYTWTATITLAR